MQPFDSLKNLAAALLIVAATSTTLSASSTPAPKSADALIQSNAVASESLELVAPANAPAADQAGSHSSHSSHASHSSHSSHTSSSF